MTSERYYRPEIASPYPEAFERIDDFDYSSHLHIGRKSNKIFRYRRPETNYVLLRDYRVGFSVDRPTADRASGPPRPLLDLGLVPLSP